MRRFLKTAILGLLAIIALTVGLALYLVHDEAFLKSRISALVMDKTGRKLSIDGQLDIALGRVVSIDAGDIRFANAAWASTPDMVRLGGLRVGIDISSVFSGTLLLTDLQLEDCAFELEKSPQGERNWVIPGKSEKGAERAPEQDVVVPLSIAHSRIENCSLKLRAPGGETTLDIRIKESDLGTGNEDRVTGHVAGTLNNQALQIEGWLAPAGVLTQGGALQYELKGHAGPITLDSSGAIADLRQLAGLDLHARFSGPEIATVLHDFQQPPVSDGDFDFRVDFATRNDLTTIDVNGDLGSLDVIASGQVDRLLRPENGKIDAKITGPDLEALGMALGLAGLVQEPYSAHVSATIQDGAMDLGEARLDTEQDQLDLSGQLRFDSELKGSKLHLKLDSKEIGRWAQLLHRKPGPGGPITLDGQLAVDAAALLTADVHVQQSETKLHVNGRLGTLGEPPDANLEISLSAPRPGRVLHWLTDRPLPDLPIDVTGKVHATPEKLGFTDLRAAFGRHKLHVDGTLGLSSDLAGTALDVGFESPDISDLGPLLEHGDLPQQPLKLQGSLGVDGPGLIFKVTDVRLGDLGLALDGKIADRKQPLGIDANFELKLPNIAVLDPWISRLKLPDGPLTVTGSLRNQADRTRLEPTRIQLGEIHLQASGDINHDKSFDLNVALQGPDASLLSAAARVELPPEAFQANGRLSGNPGQLVLKDVEARVGEVRVQANGQVTGRKQFGFTLSGSGPDASALSTIVRNPVPPLGFQLSGKLGSDDEQLTIDDLDLALGDSRVDGELALQYGDRKRITGKLHSGVFDLNPWLKPEEEEDQTGESIRRFVFDDAPVMRITDYGVDVSGDLVIDELRLRQAKSHNLTTSVSLTREHLEIVPFSVDGTFGGHFDGELILDGSDDVPKLNLKIDANQMRMVLGAYEGQDPETLPKADFQLELDGLGRTRREMAEAVDGRLRINIGPGELAPTGFDFLLSDFTTELFSRLNPFHETDKVTHLECMVAAADISAGDVTVKPVIIHEKKITIVSEGEIDLHDESLDLAFEVRQRKGLGISASDLVHPFIRVGGTLASPAMEFDAADTAVKGGLAVATVGLSLIAQSLANRYFSSKDPCGDALRELDEKDQNPP